MQWMVAILFTDFIAYDAADNRTTQHPDGAAGTGNSTDPDADRGASPHHGQHDCHCRIQC